MKTPLPWFKDDRSNRVLMTFGAGLAARAVQAVALLAQVPLAIEHLGVPIYGVWMALASVASVILLADLGLSSSLTSLIADALGRDDKRQAGTYFTSALIAVICVAVAVASACWIGASYVPWASLLSLDIREAATAVGVFRVLSVAFALNLVAGLFSRCRIACQEGYRNSLFEASGALTALAGLFVAKHLGADTPSTVAATLGAGLLPPMLNAVLLIRKKPWLFQADRIAMTRTAPRLIRLSAGFLILTLAHVFAFQTQGAIISYFSGPRAAAEYAVGLRLFGLLPQFFALLLTPLWPAYRDACARGEMRWATRMLALSLVFTAALSVLTAFVLLHLSEPIIAAWLDQTVAPSMPLRIWFAIWAATNCVAGCLAMFYHGVGWMRFQVLQTVPVALAVAILWPLLGPRFGAAGILGAYVLAHVAFVLLPGLVRIRSFIAPPGAAIN